MSALVVALLTATIATTALAATSATAGAETASLPVTVTPTSPTTGLVDGSTVSVHVTAESPPNAAPSAIYQVEARLCPATETFDFSADFNPSQLGKCILHPLSAGSDAKTGVDVPPPFLQADLSFKVGVGTDTYNTQDNQPVNIQCGPGKPCKLVLKLQVPNAVAFTSIPLYYQGDTPPGARFHPLTPTRILDSRTPNGGWDSKLVSGTPRELTIRNNGGVPNTAEAVVVNLTVTGGSANSFLSAYPSGGNVPNVSNVNFAVGQTIPNLATVKIGSNGKISFANNTGAVDVIADVVGYYDAAAENLYNAVIPARILDSRDVSGPWAGTKLVAGANRDLTVRGVGGVPAGAEAVVVNVTATGGTANSFITAFPAGVDAPTASNVNFAAGETIPNLVTVKVGAAGKVTFKNNTGAVDVIVDVVGYFDPSAGDLFFPIEPTRILDSRTNNGGFNSTKLTAASPRNLTVAGAGGVAPGASAVVGNATVTGSTANSFLTLYPAGETKPNVSNLNFAVGQTIPNLTAVKLGAGGANAGKITFATAIGSTDVIYDVVGYYAP